MEAQVERVQHEAAAGDAEVRLQVLIVVPCKRRHAVAGLEAELPERDGELLRPARHVAVGVAVEALVGQAGDDLLVAEERLRAPQQRRERQLESPSSGPSRHLSSGHGLAVAQVVRVNELAVALDVAVLAADDEEHEVVVAGVRHLPRRRRLDVARARPGRAIRSSPSTSKRAVPASARSRARPGRRDSGRPRRCRAGTRSRSTPNAVTPSGCRSCESRIRRRARRSSRSCVPLPTSGRGAGKPMRLGPPFPRGSELVSEWGLAAALRWTRARQGRRERPYQADTGATEDAASRRPARRGGSAPHSETSSVASKSRRTIRRSRSGAGSRSSLARSFASRPTR